MSDMFEIILLEQFGQNKTGDVIKVHQGLYDTLITAKKGVPLNCLDEKADEKTKLAINAKTLEAENDHLYADLEKAYAENTKLTKEIARLKKCKDLRTKPQNKKIKKDEVETKLIF